MVSFPQVDPSPPGELIWRGAADDLNKISGTYVPGKCALHFLGIELKVFRQALLLELLI